MLKAYDEKTGEEVKPGDIVTDSTGEKAMLVEAIHKRCKNSDGIIKVRNYRGDKRRHDRVFNLIVKSVEGMEWRQQRGNIWNARGKDGVFVIVRSDGKFWTSYSSTDTHFKMKPTSKLEDAQAQCENSEYWEHVK